jgi:hypothetical protein
MRWNRSQELGRYEPEPEWIGQQPAGYAPEPEWIGSKPELIGAEPEGYESTSSGDDPELQA